MPRWLQAVLTVLAIYLVFEFPSCGGRKEREEVTPPPRVENISVPQWVVVTPPPRVVPPSNYPPVLPPISSIPPREEKVLYYDPYLLYNYVTGQGMGSTFIHLGWTYPPQPWAVFFREEVLLEWLK